VLGQTGRKAGAAMPRAALAKMLDSAAAGRRCPPVARSRVKGDGIAFDAVFPPSGGLAASLFATPATQPCAI